MKRWGVFEPGDTAVISVRHGFLARLWSGIMHGKPAYSTYTLRVIDPGDRNTARLSDGKILAHYGKCRFEVYRAGSMVYWQDRRA